MISTLKAAALAFIAVLAISATATSAAQAEGLFEAEEYPATITSEQTQQFEFKIPEVGTVICKSSSFTGELTAAFSQLSVHPTFSECTVSGSAASVETTGCNWVLHGAQKISEEEYSSLMDIACAQGAVIKIDLPLGCTLTITGQVNLSEIDIRINLGFPPSIEIVSKLAEVQAELENTPGKTCFFGTKKLKVTVGGKAKWSADNNKGKQVGLTVSG